MKIINPSRVNRISFLLFLLIFDILKIKYLNVIKIFLILVLECHFSIIYFIPYKYLFCISKPIIKLDKHEIIKPLIPK